MGYQFEHKKRDAAAATTTGIGSVCDRRIYCLSCREHRALSSQSLPTPLIS